MEDSNDKNQSTAKSVLFTALIRRAEALPMPFIAFFSPSADQVQVWTTNKKR